MSGFACIVNLDGAPVNRAVLDQMGSLLAFRGPDAKHVSISGNAGFAFTLLRATEEAVGEQQPFTFDRQVWIVADARIDARQELIAKLQAKGRDASLDRPDVELILHSYHAWGEACVDHLLGDFAFAIWDSAEQRLFGARDQMGIKPLYYATAGSTIAVSNTMNCLRVQPGVSSRLNDSAIADFLLFEHNRDKATTFFADIQRVPPGHTIGSSPLKTSVQAYWTLPIDEPLRYRNLDDYPAHFREVLGEAVRDRCRGDHVGIFLSGGLDSTTLAALSPTPADVCAYTYVFDGYDQERPYAKLAADDLGMKMVIREGFAEGIDPNWESGDVPTNEPSLNPMLLDRDRAFFQEVARSHRVMLCGEGPDAALHYEWRPYLEYLARGGRWGSLVREVLVHMALHRRLPLISTIPRAWRESRMERNWAGGYPTWLNVEFEQRMGLAEQWKEGDRSALLHPIRPIGYRSLLRARWQGYFEEFDSSGTGAPIEFRHPYFDIRVLRFLLAVPALPWCRRKYLLRRAMRGRLPEAILQRDKTPLYPDPWTALAQKTEFRPMDAAPGLSEYVDKSKVFSGRPGTLADFRDAIRPRGLNYWLKSIGHFPHNRQSRRDANGQT